MAYLEYFDQRALDLNSEVIKHPLLMEQIAPHTDPAMKLAVIAAYCDVMLDGAYNEEECNKLCEILTKRLVAKREGSGSNIIVA